MGIGTSQEYNSRGDGSFTGSGKNWMPHNMAGLSVQGNLDVIYEEGPRQMEYYVKDGSAYTPRYYVRSKLTKETDHYLLTNPDGERRKFALSGELLEIRNPAGKIATVAYTDGEINHVLMTDSDPDIDDVKYDYTWAGGLLQTIDYLARQASDPRTRSPEPGAENLT